MTARILVAYASRAGSTAGAAEAIGQVLRDRGADVDVRSVKEVQGVGRYDALVLGSAVWVGKPLPEAVRFAAAHADALAPVPVAYFILCDTLQEDTPANRATARRYVGPLMRIKQPVSLGLFAGARDLSQVHPLLRWFLMRVIGLAEGDWRDWEQIRAWAADLPARLERARPAAVGIGRPLGREGGCDVALHH
jgi:menaquinone-dependent protoporphyrinogen oxidase